MTLSDALRDQAASCDALGSPFMGRLLRLLADRLRAGTPVADRLMGWEGDVTSRGHSVPLRLAGALHALKLRDADGPLARVYPPHDASDEALWKAVAQAMATDATFINAFLDSAPQTNEVRRSAALLPAALIVHDRFGLPLRLSELGASAGLNLLFDHYAVQIGERRFGTADPALTLRPDWSGSLPPDSPFEVADRRGVDLNPLTGPLDAARLRAYLWADQPERLALTNAALALPRPAVDRADAAPWLEARLNAAQAGQTHFVFHTIAWQYFPSDVQTHCATALEAAGRQASSDAPLAWMAMEADDIAGRGAALTLRLWPGDVTLSLGRADFHGRWIDWDPREV